MIYPAERLQLYPDFVPYGTKSGYRNRTWPGRDQETTRDGFLRQEESAATVWEAERNQSAEKESHGFVSTLLPPHARQQNQELRLEGELRNLVAGWSFQSQRLRRLGKSDSLIFGNLLDAHGNAVSVHRLQRNRSENQHVRSRRISRTIVIQRS